MTFGKLPGGKAMPIAGASVKVAGQTVAKETNANDREASVRTRLNAGTTTDLRAWFRDAAGNDVCGAFYASVRRV